LCLKSKRYPHVLPVSEHKRGHARRQQRWSFHLQSFEDHSESPLILA